MHWKMNGMGPLLLSSLEHYIDDFIAKINPTLRHKLLASKTQSPLDSVKPLINFVATEKLYKKITQKNCAPVLTLDSLLCTKTCAYRFILEFRQRK